MLDPDDLTWSFGKYEHTGALNRFVCADPSSHGYEPRRGRHHPKQWELDVQSGIRGLRLPSPNSESLLLAFDSEAKIAAVSRMSFDLDWEHLMILAIAVSGHGFTLRTSRVSIYSNLMALRC